MIPEFPNPWGLTKREADVLSAIAEHGSARESARALGVAEKAVNKLVYGAKKRMKIATLIQAAIAWDRWMRDGEAAEDGHRVVLTDTVVDLVATAE